MQQKQIRITAEELIIIKNVYHRAHVKGTLEDYINRIVFIYPALVSGTGIVCAEDAYDNTLIDVSMYLKNFAPPIEIFQAIAYILAEYGYSYVYADNSQSEKIRVSNKICEKVGMQCIGQNLYALQLNGEKHAMQNKQETEEEI